MKYINPDTDFGPKFKLEAEIKDVLESFDNVIIPGAACWEFPKYNLKLHFSEVITATKILKWMLCRIQVEEEEEKEKNNVKTL